MTAFKREACNIVQRSVETLGISTIGPGSEGGVCESVEEEREPWLRVEDRKCPEGAGDTTV